jgi:hypothetical protein
MTLDLGGILRRAWTITWNHKILWLFGILAGLAGGGGNPGNNNNFRDTFQYDFSSGELPPAMRDRFGDVDPNIVLAILLGLACVALIIALVLFVIGVVARGGLIGGIRLADTQGRVTFGQAWSIGVRKFWTVLVIGLIVFVVGILITAISVVSICLTPLACLGFLIVAVLGVFTQLAQIAAVVDDLSFGDALSRALQFVSNNLVNVLVLGLILVIIQAVVGFVIALPIIAVVFPAAAAIFIGASNEAQTVATTAMALACLCLVAYVPIIIVLGGILQTWTTSAWTLAYQQLTGRAPAPAAPSGVVPA